MRNPCAPVFLPLPGVSQLFRKIGPLSFSRSTEVRVHWSRVLRIQSHRFHLVGATHREKKHTLSYLTQSFTMPPNFIKSSFKSPLNLIFLPPHSLAYSHYYPQKFSSGPQLTHATQAWGSPALLPIFESRSVTTYCNQRALEVSHVHTCLPSIHPQSLFLSRQYVANIVAAYLPIIPQTFWTKDMFPGPAMNCG